MKATFPESRNAAAFSPEDSGVRYLLAISAHYLLLEKSCTGQQKGWVREAQKEGPGLSAGLPTAEDPWRDRPAREVHGEQSLAMICLCLHSEWELLSCRHFAVWVQKESCPVAAEDKSLARIFTEIIITLWLSHFISVCTAADAHVLQLSGLFHKLGDHRGLNNCRKGHMLPSNASPMLCCSLNFIQTLTKCTYFSNSTNGLLLLDILEKGQRYKGSIICHLLMPSSFFKLAA